MLEFCKWLEQTPVGASVRESLWLFPVIEIVHLLGMAALIGTIGALDLRLMGLTLRGRPVSELAAQLLPWAWAGFVLQVITGALLFSSEAIHVYANPAFRVKMLLIGLGGLHALVFRLTIYRGVSGWDESSTTPPGAKVAGLVSILIWVGVVAAGRFIGFI